MEYVGSTYKILCYRVLEWPIDKEWIDWAIEMIQAGFETENLLYLASFDLTENQFKLQEVANKAFKELHLDLSDRMRVINNYVNYTIEIALSRKIDYYSALNTLNGLYLGSLDFLSDFNQLYWAKYDLIASENTWEWPGANRDNIDSIIENYFKNWQAQFQNGAPKTNSDSNEPNHSSLS